jgi:hypothetical protein
MSEVQAPVITEREITIYATRGGQMKKIMTSATTWGELQPLVRSEGFDLSSLLAAENINKSDLVNDLAVLPATAFRLFLRPKQTKSGALDRKECFAAIKTHLLNYPEDKAKFSIDGRNVTQLPTATVQDLVAKYIGGVTSETPKASKPVAEVKKVETKEKPTGLALELSTEPLASPERIQEALNLITPFEGYDAYDKCYKHLNNLLREVSPSSEESEEDAIRREAKEMGY